jgi:hypothetical protein
MKNTLFISICIMLFFSANGCSDTSFGNDLWDNVTSSKITSDKQITSFSINGYKARISGTTVKSFLPLGTSVTALAPVITYNGAAISPESGVVQDFTNPVTYTVTATDGTTAVYTVSVTVLTAAEMSNANLFVLKVKKGKLQPALNDSIKDYLDAPIPFSDSANPAYNDKQSNSLIADPEILIATMTMELESNGKVSVENATEHVFPEIEVGPNKVTIIVTAADKKTTKKYNLNMYRAIPIFKTGAGKISGYDLNNYEDGATQRGVSWPNPRFHRLSTSISDGGVDNKETYIRDLLTGLFWLEGTTKDTINWSETKNYDNAVKDTCGIQAISEKWRLPNIQEMRSIANYGSIDDNNLNGFFDNYHISNTYWTSTVDMGNTGYGFNFNFQNNSAFSVNRYDRYSFLAVRNQSKVLPKTGQTYSAIDGSDGYFQKGVTWPTPRFYTDESGAVVDNMTSLMWFSDFIEPVLSGSTDKWGQSMTYISNKINSGIPKNYGYTDWTLPNINEIESLTNYEYESLDWLKSFITYQNRYLWTSTSSSASYAYSFIPSSQKIEITDKDTFNYILPVRQAKIINY